MGKTRLFNGRRFKLIDSFKKKTRLLKVKNEIRQSGKKVRVVKLRGKLVSQKWMLYAEGE